MPQEIEVFYIIPAIRRGLALAMKANGLKQNRIAELLNLEEGAVSQYVSGKRGNQVSFSKQINEEIKKSSLIVKENISLLRETQRLLTLVKTSGSLCEIHKQFSDVPNTCGFNVVKCNGEVSKDNAPNVKLKLT